MTPKLFIGLLLTPELKREQQEFAHDILCVRYQGKAYLGCYAASLALDEIRQEADRLLVRLQSNYETHLIERAELVLFPQLLLGT